MKPRLFFILYLVIQVVRANPCSKNSKQKKEVLFLRLDKIQIKKNNNSNFEERKLERQRKL